MDTVTIKHKVIEELDLLPEDTLPDLYRLIHYFRLGLLADKPTSVHAKEMQEYTANDEDEQALKREQEAFIALHPQLLARYPGEEVAIYQGKVVDHDVDGVALSSRIYKRFPNEFVWIAPVTADPIEEWRIYSPRFEPLVS